MILGLIRAKILFLTENKSFRFAQPSDNQNLLRKVQVLTMWGQNMNYVKRFAELAQKNVFFGNIEVTFSKFCARECRPFT